MISVYVRRGFLIYSTSVNKYGFCDQVNFQKHWAQQQKEKRIFLKQEFSETSDIRTCTMIL